MILGRSLTALAALSLLLTACGSGESSGDADEAPSRTGDPQSGIVATSADGTTVAFKDFTVTCRPSEEDQPEAQIVSARSGWDFESGEPTKPAMMIEAADTAGGTTVDLPFSEVWGEEKTFLVAFITEVGEDKALSAGKEMSSGRIEIVSASCDPEPRLEVRVDGSFESEVSDATVTVKGSLVTD